MGILQRNVGGRKLKGGGRRIWLIVLQCIDFSLFTFLGLVLH